MIKKVFSKNYINDILKKYNIPKEYTSINKKMISRGAFIGLFIAMIPMPFQLVTVFIFTFIGKFNFPIAIAMCLLTNPFTMPFVYLIEYKTGSYLLGMEIMDVQMNIQWFRDNLSNIVIPLYFGAFCYSMVLSTLAYFSINYYWKKKVYSARRAKKRWKPFLQ